MEQTQTQTRTYLGYVRVTTKSGNSWTTAYNAKNVSREEIANYFMGHIFNVGVDENDENQDEVTKVEFLE